MGKGFATWPQMTQQLSNSQLNIITEDAHLQASKLYTFGRLMGNTDMHLGNIAFFYEGILPLSIALIYDMLPMGFSPRNSGDLVDFLPTILPPLHTSAEIWREMLPIAEEYWQRLSIDQRCSPTFQQIAKESLQ